VAMDSIEVACQVGRVARGDTSDVFHDVGVHINPTRREERAAKAVKLRE
jgi:hypothetical protein